jgi:hypothetical protein
MLQKLLQFAMLSAVNTNLRDLYVDYNSSELKLLSITTNLHNNAKEERRRTPDPGKGPA